MEKSLTHKIISISLVYFIVVAGIGLILRLSMADLVDLPYTHWLHTHSHIAFMGWVFNLIFVFTIDKYKLKGAWITRQFIAFQVAIIGMLVSFPYQGYGAISIAFSTLHIVISIFFFRKIYSSIKGKPGSIWIRTALIFMIVSALGPFTLGPLAALGYKGTIWYNLSIQYYLHFYYNGWFFLALIGLLIKSDTAQTSKAFKWIVPSMFPLFFTAVMVYDQSLWIRMLSLFGSFGFSIGIYHLFKANLINPLKGKSNWLFNIIIASLFFKCLMQLAINIPGVDLWATSQRHLVIGYMHLTFLGILTPILFLLIAKYSKISSIAIGIYLMGFLITEVVLFSSFLLSFTIIQGSLVFGSALIFVASIWLFVSQILSETTEEKVKA